jgi:hypothetical protein
MRSFTIPLTLLAALGAGCVDDSSDGGIFITKAVAVAGETCTLTSTADEMFLPHGVWSSLSPRGYRLFPQMVSRITADDTQINQRTIILQGARIDIDITDDTLAGELDLQKLKDDGITKFQSRFTAPLPPNGGITDGVIDLVTPELIDAIAAVHPELLSLQQSRPVFRTELLANVVVFGDMAGSEITSQKFTFPVTLCNDCVVNVVGACPLPAGSTPRAGNVCNPFQDGSVDCCVEPSGALTCPGRVDTTSAP